MAVKPTHDSAVGVGLAAAGEAKKNAAASTISRRLQLYLVMMIEPAA
jgi:hypothetical protein